MHMPRTTQVRTIISNQAKSQIAIHQANQMM